MQDSTFSPLELLYVGSNENLTKELTEQSDKFIIHQFNNGLKANIFINSGSKIDAVLFDAYMHGMDGMEYAKMLKSRQEFLKTPLIMVAFEKDEDLFKKSFSNKGIIDDLYYYPLNFTNLYNRIKSIDIYYSEISEKKVIKQKKYEYKIPFFKRIFDILVSSTALLLLSPILLITALAIRIESKGAVVYKSKRVGTGYKIIEFLKFRSMYTGADAKLKELKHLNQYAEKKDKKESSEEDDHILNTDCPQCANLPEGEHCSPYLYIKGQQICENWFIKQKKEMGNTAFIKISNDPRVTKVGNFIRNTSIDELPQLINVLKGDMSIVGNRPLPLYEAELLTSDDWSLRFLGPAGITGLWQVELRGKKGVMSEEERKTLDNQYAKNYSFWGDIKLILRTIPALLQKDNV
jgi:lipopolysaccharide/colanic/teichoic acid biosynthesis glycosyltransferase